MRTLLLSPATPGVLFAVLSSGCIEPEWVDDGGTLTLVEPLSWEPCGDPCHLGSPGEAVRLDGLEGSVSSATGHVCAVPSPDDLAWTVVPNEGSRLVAVGEQEGSAVHLEATACEPGDVGDPCVPVDAGLAAHLFLVAMNEGDVAACELLRGSDFEERE